MPKKKVRWRYSKCQSLVRQAATTPLPNRRRRAFQCLMAASLSSLINDHAPAVTPLRCIRFADSWRLERETVWLATSSIATCTPRVLCDMIMNSRRRSSAITRMGPAAPRGRAGANRNLARLACSQSSEHTGMTGRTIAHKSGSLSGAHVLLGQNHTCVASFLI